MRRLRFQRGVDATLLLYTRPDLPGVLLALAADARARERVLGWDLSDRNLYFADLAEFRKRGLEVPWVGSKGKIRLTAQ